MLTLILLHSTSCSIYSNIVIHFLDTTWLTFISDAFVLTELMKVQYILQAGVDVLFCQQNTLLACLILIICDKHY